MMKQQKQLYLHPTVKVVCFKVEDVFLSLKSTGDANNEPIESLSENETGRLTYTAFERPTQEE